MGGHCRRLLLLRLLALLDAATGPGLPVSRPEDLAPPVAPKSPSRGGPSPSAGPRQGHPPPGTRGSAVPATLPSSWAGKAPAEQGGQTSPATWLSAESQSGPSRAGGQPHTASPPSRPASSTRLSPAWASSPTSALLKGHPGQAPGPTEGGGGGSASQEPPTLTPLPPGSRGAPAGPSIWAGAETSPPAPKAGPGGGPAAEQRAGTEGAERNAPEPPRTTPSSQVAKVPPGTAQGGSRPTCTGQPLVNDAGRGPMGVPVLGGPPWPEKEPPWEGSSAVAPSPSPPSSPQGSLARPPPWVSSSPHTMGDGHPMANPPVAPQWPTGGDQAPLWTPSGLPAAAHSLWGAPGKKEGVRTPLPAQETPYSTTAPRPTLQTAWGGGMDRGPPGTTEEAPQQELWGAVGPEPPGRGSPGMVGGQVSARGVFPSSRPPKLHSQSQAFSGPTSEPTAGSTGGTGGTRGAPGQPAWTAHPWGLRPRSPTASRLKDALQPWPGGVPTPDSLAGQLDNAGREGSPAAPMELLATATAAGGPEADGPRATSPTVPREGKPMAHPVVLVAENQPPLLKAAFLPVPCELVLDMAFSRSFRDPRSPERQSFVRSLNETVSPLLASLPGFQHLDVRNIRPGSLVVEFDALFRPQAAGFWRALNRSALSERLPPGLRVGNASVLRSATRERHLDLCALLFSCPVGYECVMEEAEEEEARAACVSLCHRGFCKNHGICTHLANHAPACQCPVGSDFWFLGAHCDYRVTQQAVLGVACGLVLSLVVLGVLVAGLVARRVRLLLLEARADQAKSSYRRFCRLDDVSAHYWSEPWLDNPAFSRSEELLHLQRMETPCDGGGQGPQGGCRWTLATPGEVRAAGRPSPPPGQPWAESCSSLNDPMVDSGKASEASVSSWPLEPPFFRWSPFPALKKLPRDPASKTPRPNSCSEGMELVNLERSWTA